MKETKKKNVNVVSSKDEREHWHTCLIFPPPNEVDPLETFHTLVHVSMEERENDTDVEDVASRKEEGDH